MVRTQILVNKWAPRTVVDPDLQIRGGGDGGGHPVPEIRGGGAGLKKFFRPLRPQLGAGEGWALRAPPLDPPQQTKVFGAVLWTQ